MFSLDTMIKDDYVRALTSPTCVLQFCGFVEITLYSTPSHLITSICRKESQRGQFTNWSSTRVWDRILLLNYLFQSSISEFNIVSGIVVGLTYIAHGGKHWDFQHDFKGGMETPGTLNSFFFFQVWVNCIWLRTFVLGWATFLVPVHIRFHRCEVGWIYLTLVFIYRHLFLFLLSI